MGAEIPLTLAYKLNSVCNAGFWPTVQIKKTCIPKWDTHKINYKLSIALDLVSVKI